MKPSDNSSISPRLSLRLRFETIERQSGRRDGHGRDLRSRHSEMKRPTLRATPPPPITPPPTAPPCGGVEFLDCYLVVARLGHPEPAGALLRSLYETTVWARWVVSSPERAKRYFDAGRADMAKTVMRVVSRGLAAVKIAPEPDVFKAILKAEVKANRLAEHR